MNRDKQRIRHSKRKGPPRERAEEKREVQSTVLYVNRCAKVVKGGRRFSFSAIVVMGNPEKHLVGVGLGKANEVPEAIRKGTENAEKNMVSINIRGNTIPHEVIGKADGGRVLLKPASQGTGIIAGGAVRAILKSVGVKDVLSKSLRSNNPQAMVNAAMNALKQLRSAAQIRILLKSTPTETVSVA